MRINFNTSTRWAFICGVSVGVLVAFPLAAPLFGGKILEGVATLWGNALGAIGAVAAAIWAGDRSANLQQRQGAGLIFAFVDPVAQDLAKLTALYIQIAPADDSEAQPSHLPDLPTTHEIAHLGHAVNGTYRSFQKATHRVENAFGHLGPVEMHVFLDLESELERMQSVVGSLLHHVTSAHNQALGHTPSTGLRTRLLKTNKNVQELVSRLQEAAR